MLKSEAMVWLVNSTWQPSGILICWVFLIFKGKYEPLKQEICVVIGCGVKTIWLVFEI